MKQLLSLLLLVAFALPAAASDLQYPSSGKVQVIQPAEPGTAGTVSNTQPASEAEVLRLIDALNVKDSLRASIETSSPLVKQSYNDLLKRAMQQTGASLTPEQTAVLSQRITEKYNKLKAAMFDWMIKEYVKRHRATYTQAETLQLLNFMQSPVGQKYVQSDSRIWAGILTEANAEFAKLVPATVATVFREAGALR